MCRRRRCRSSSFGGLKTPFADGELAPVETFLEAVEIEFDIVRDRMSGREVFGIHLYSAAGTVAFHDADPERIGGEIEIRRNDSRVDFARIAMVHPAAFLVILARGAE